MVVEICIEFITQRTTTCSGTLYWPSSGSEMKKLSKQLYSTYVGLHSGVVRGEVGTRSGMCYVGWVVWVRGLLLYAIVG